MKKNILILFTFLVTTMSLAQGIAIGIKTGINFASLSDAEAGLSNKSGFQAGAFPGLNFCKINHYFKLLTNYKRIIN